MQQQQQFYPATVQRHGEHVYHHPGAGYIHPAAAARMQWSPANVQHGQWAYDLAGAYPGFVPSMPGLHSPDPQSAATPHNIRDILSQSGGQSADTLQSEIAKTPSAYQKSPSSAGAATGTVFHYPNPSGQDHLRSPTTPNHPAEIPQFYIPALQGKPFVGFDPTALSSDPIHGLPPGLAYYGGPGLDPKGGSSPLDKNGSASKDGKKEKKGRATFSGNQIDELEKIFNSNQYLTNQERHNLAERLSLSENQVKIWFQNRRTKCRRTSWKRPSSMTSPTTPTAPVSFPPNAPTTPTDPNPPPPSTH